ncbi:hypothetical protein CJ468_06472 [Nocardia farcinica]|nr:hypothetical protein CJ468_06472 [Nocardia farcinica]
MVTPRLSTTAGGMRSAFARSAAPASVRFTWRLRSSRGSRSLVISPAASSRLSSGDSVGESSWMASAMALTDIGARSHSASITRYCGWVSPSGSSSGR